MQQCLQLKSTVVVPNQHRRVQIQQVDSKVGSHMRMAPNARLML